MHVCVGLVTVDGSRAFPFEDVFGPDASQHEVFTRCLLLLMNARKIGRNA